MYTVDVISLVEDCNYVKYCILHKQNASHSGLNSELCATQTSSVLTYRLDTSTIYFTTASLFPQTGPQNTESSTLPQPLGLFHLTYFPKEHYSHNP
eukprot:c37544_g1_i1 orf=3-287(-)